MTTELNGLALLLLAGFLGIVVYNGKLDDLTTELLKEKGFIIWVVALVIVFWLWRSSSAGRIIGSIAGLGLLATFFVLTNTDAVKSLVEGSSK